MLLFLFLFLFLSSLFLSSFFSLIYLIPSPLSSSVPSSLPSFLSSFFLSSFPTPFLLSFLLAFETRSQYVAQVGLEPMTLLLSLPSAGLKVYAATPHRNPLLSTPRVTWPLHLPVSPLAAFVFLAGCGWCGGNAQVSPACSNRSIVVDNDVVLEENYTPEYKMMFRNATEIVRNKIMNETSTIATDSDLCRCKSF